MIFCASQGSRSCHGEMLIDRLSDESQSRAASSACRVTDSDRSAIIPVRSEEHTSELQSLMRISYAVFCLKKKKHTKNENTKKTKNKNQTNRYQEASKKNT